MAALVLITLITLQGSDDFRWESPFDLNIARTNMAEIFQFRLSTALNDALIEAGLAASDVEIIVSDAADRSAQCVLDAWQKYPDDNTQSFLSMIGDPDTADRMVEQLKRTPDVSSDVGDSTDKLRDIRLFQGEMARTCFASVTQELGLPMDLSEALQ